jgi:4-hydroxybenzoate polyprenyltransferase
MAGIVLRLNANLLPLLKYRFQLYGRLIRFDKPIGTLLLLWPTLWALWLAAEGIPDLPRLLVFVLGTWLMRSAGCVLNDIADRQYDRSVQRTEDRVLASGKVMLWEAVLVATVLLIAAATLLIFLNDLAVQFAFTAAFVAAIYPYFKRFFSMPQAILGIAFGHGILMAYADTTGIVPAIAWALFIGNLFWAIAYDTAYAMVDRQDDLKLGLRSSAITFGRFDTLAIGGCYVVFLWCMSVVGQSLVGAASTNWVFWLSWLITALLCAVLTLRTRSRDRDQCFAVFKANNWVGLILFLGIALQLGF